jgi:8-oxo-dGTP diphosphatase
MCEQEKRFLFAVKAFIISDGRVLIIRRSVQARCDYHYWELPGGRLEFGETPVDTVKREVLEEVGLEVVPIRPLSNWTVMKDENTQLIGATYLCRLESGSVMLSKEHEEFTWVDIGDIDDYNFCPGVAEDIKGWDWERLTDELLKVSWFGK